MKTQAHLSSCHGTNVNTSTSVPIMFLMTTQAHPIMLLVITQEQPSSHHVTHDNTSPHQRPSVAFGNTSPRTISFLCSLLQKFPVLYEVTSGHTFHSCNMCFRTIHALNKVPTEAPLFTADQGGLQVSTPYVLEIMKRCTVS